MTEYIAFNLWWRSFVDYDNFAAGFILQNTLTTHIQYISKKRLETSLQSSCDVLKNETVLRIQDFWMEMMKGCCWWFQRIVAAREGDSGDMYGGWLMYLFLHFTVTVLENPATSQMCVSVSLVDSLLLFINRPSSPYFERLSLPILHMRWRELATCVTTNESRALSERDSFPTSWKKV